MAPLPLMAGWSGALPGEVRGGSCHCQPPCRGQTTPTEPTRRSVTNTVRQGRAALIELPALVLAYLLRKYSGDLLFGQVYARSRTGSCGHVKGTCLSPNRLTRPPS